MECVQPRHNFIIDSSLFSILNHPKTLFIALSSDAGLLHLTHCLTRIAACARKNWGKKASFVVRTHELSYYAILMNSICVSEKLLGTRSFNLVGAPLLIMRSRLDGLESGSVFQIFDQ